MSVLVPILSVKQSEGYEYEVAAGNVERKQDMRAMTHFSCEYAFHNDVFNTISNAVIC